jgi:glycosyltransferase involved in cell wall biosynthesis
MPRYYREYLEGQSQPVELSLIIPCLNEEENIGFVIDYLCKVLKQNNITNVETLVLDDSSTDNTFDKAVECFQLYPDLNIRVIRRYEPRRGYGAVVRFGIANAKGIYCIPVSADGVDPLDVIPTFLQKMRDGADMVQCSRYLKEKDADTIPFKYKFFQTGWRFLVKLLLHQDVRDSTYSYKIFRRTDVLGFGIISNGFSISPEIFFKILLSGGNIEYVPHGQGVRKIGKSHFVFLREGTGYSYVLLRAWLHRLGILWF